MLKILERLDYTYCGEIFFGDAPRAEWYSSMYTVNEKSTSVSKNISLEDKIERNEPTSGWRTFVSRLNHLGIYKLKNFDQIPGYDVCMDGNYITIETWKNGAYHLYDYPCYDLLVDKVEEVKIVKTICLLIQTEFQYKIFQ